MELHHFDASTDHTRNVSYEGISPPKSPQSKDFATRLFGLRSARKHLSDPEYVLLEELHCLTGASGCRPGNPRLQADLGWTRSKLNDVIGGLTGAPSARARRPSIAARPSLLSCSRKRYVDPIRKRTTWRRSFHINWQAITRLGVENQQGLGLQKTPQRGGLGLQESDVCSSGFESASQILQPETHTARAREAEPDDNARADDGVCVFSSETEPEKANPEPPKPKPKPAQQESDVSKRRANGPPESSAGDTDAKFTIIAAAYGMQEGHLGKARGVFASVVGEYEVILRHVNHSARRREKQQPQNRLWLWRYLTDAPWRIEPVPPRPYADSGGSNPMAYPGESEEAFRERLRRDAERARWKAEGDEVRKRCEPQEDEVSETDATPDHVHVVQNVAEQVAVACAPPQPPPPRPQRPPILQRPPPPPSAPPERDAWIAKLVAMGLPAEDAVRQWELRYGRDALNAEVRP